MGFGACVNGNEASDERGRGAISGVEGQGIARFGVDADGRRWEV
jgi:hypothetical protein